MTNPIINFQNVSFAYSQHPILEDVTFSIEKGHYLGIIGPNGSGKTTLLKLLLGLIKPTQGKITILDGSPQALKDRWRLGYVSQRVTHLDFQFPATVLEVVRSGRTAKSGFFHVHTQADHLTVEKALKVTKITSLKDRLIGELSGGERQRVFIARALAGEPELLILDEPTVGVDITAQEEFYTLLCELHNEHGLTILLVSHDIDIVAQEVSSVLFLNRKVIAYGKAKDLMQEGNLEKLYGSQVKFITHKHEGHS